MKSKTLYALALTLLLACCLALASCGTQVKLVDFGDTTEEVLLGEKYTLPSPLVYDADGNQYLISFEVKDSSDKKVTVDANQFTVSDMGGYKIISYASISGTQYSRTVTLTVKDTGKPVLTVAESALGYVGTPYTLPKISVSDLSGEKISASYKLYYKDGESFTEVAVSDGSFIPEDRGIYVIKAVATDSSGNEGEAQAEIKVRSALAPYVIEDFNDEYGITTDANFLNGASDTSEEYLSDYNGKTGVVKAYSDKNIYGYHQYFKFPLTSSELADINFEYIYVRCYIDYFGETAKTTVQINSKNTILGNYKIGEWVDILITPDNIASTDSFFNNSYQLQEGETPRDAFNRLMTSDKGFTLFYIPDGTNYDKYNVYIDEIGYKLSYAPIMDIESGYELGGSIIFNSTPANEISDYTVVYTVTDPSGNITEGEEGETFKFVRTGTYTVKAALTSDTQSGISVYTVNVADTLHKAEIKIIGQLPQDTASGDTVTVPQAEVYDSEGQLLDTGVNTDVSYYGNYVQIDAEGAFVINGGYTIITYTAVYDGCYYEKTVSIFAERKAAEAGEIESFSDGSALETVDMRDANGQKAQKQYVYDAPLNGTHGSVKFSFNQNAMKNGYPELYVSPRLAVTEYEGFNKVYITFKIESSALKKTEVAFWTGTNKKITVNTNQWVTVALEASDFTARYDNLASMTNDKGWFWINNNNNNTDIQSVYLYDISAGYEQPSSELAVFDDNYDIYKISTWVNNGNDITEFVNQDVIDNSQTELPPLAQGEEGYARISLNGSAGGNGKLFVGITPDCTLEEFKQSISMTFKIYAQSSADNIGMYLMSPDGTKSDFVVNIKPAQGWNTVNIVLTYDAAQMEALYNLIKTQRVFSFEIGQQENVSLSFASVRLNKASGNTVVTFDSQDKLSAVSLWSQNANVLSYVDQSVIDADTALPALSADSTGYAAVKVSGTVGGNGRLFVGVKPQCLYDDFSAASCIKIKAYAKTSAANVGFYFNGNWKANLKPQNGWNELSLDISALSAAEKAALYKQMFSSTVFAFDFGTVSDIALYIAAITLA